jgi:Peptidase family M23
MRIQITAFIIILFSTSGIGQHYEFSNGLYRIGYQDNTPVSVVSDVYTHSPLGKYDIVTDANDPYIVAAADGWIRWIEEEYDEACYMVINGEVHCCWEHNNYIVIEHPNGEWSQYTHIQQWSASDLGLEVNDWVTAGQPIGIEGEVGCASEDHLHLEISRPFDPAFPFDTVGGFLNNLGEMLIPVVCGIQPHSPWLTHGDMRISGPCNDNCPAAFEVNISLGNGGQYVARADDHITTSDSQNVVFASGSTAQFRAGDYIIMKPGFQAAQGTKFGAILRTCNGQN